MNYILNIMVLIPRLGTADAGMGAGTSLPDGHWEEIKLIHRGTTYPYHRTVGRREIPVQGLPIYAGGGNL